MKVLYIASNQTNDFLSDAVFHGLHNIEGVEVTDFNNLWYMFNDIDKSSLVNKFHGRGFTYYADLKPVEVDRSNVLNKIQSLYFDKVIYGNPRRCLDLYDQVSQYYHTEKIIFLDGNDEHNQPGVYEELLGRGVYFRRELSIDDKQKHPSIKPISFAFPENKIQVSVPNKEKLLAQIIPGVSETFTFNDEESYLNDYRSSLFGFTWRKAGWDCLRHYEILGSDCIPLFLDIEACPETICTTIPKSILKEYYKASGIYDLFEMDRDVVYDDKRCLVINKDLTKINDIEITKEFLDLYMNFLNILKEYNIKNITTKALAKYVLS
jgi:hypothetical protein